MLESFLIQGLPTCRICLTNLCMVTTIAHLYTLNDIETSVYATKVKNLHIHSPFLHSKLISFNSNWLVIWLSFSFTIKKTAKLPANQKYSKGECRQTQC